MDFYWLLRILAAKPWERYTRACNGNATLSPAFDMLYLFAISIELCT